MWKIANNLFIRLQTQRYNISGSRVNRVKGNDALLMIATNKRVQQYYQMTVRFLDEDFTMKMLDLLNTAVDCLRSKYLMRMGR